MTSLKAILSVLKPAVQETATLTWTIGESYPFAQLKMASSPKFSSLPNSHNQFQLAYCTLDVFDDKQISVIVLAYSGPKMEAFFRYRVSILDADGVKHHTEEYVWHFDCTVARLFEDNPTFYLPRAHFSDLLVNGSLKIYCEVDVLADTVFSPQEQLESYGKLSKNYETLLNSGKLTDFIVAIGEKEFRVHKAILAAQSPVFAAMFEHDDTKEVKGGRMVIEDIEADVFELLIRYIYTGKVNTLGEHADELFAAADKYQLDLLKFACDQSLFSSLTVESVCGVLLLADMHNAKQLKSDCIEYMVEHAKEVMQTEGWKQLLKSKRADLVGELFEKFVIKD